MCKTYRKNQLWPVTIDRAVGLWKTQPATRPVIQLHNWLQGQLWTACLLDFNVTLQTVTPNKIKGPTQRSES